MLTDLLGGIGTAAWVAALVGPGRLWLRGKRATGIIALILIIQGTTFLLLTPQAVNAFSHAVPSEPNIGILVRDVGGMLLAWTVQLLVLRAASAPADRPRRARWRTILLVVVIIAMIATFAPAFHNVRLTDDYIYLAVDLPLLQAYICLYLAYFAAAVWDIGMLSWKVSTVSGRRHVRVGMRCLVGSSFWALLYILSMLDKLVTVSTHRALAGWERVDSPIFVAIAGALLIIGLVTPGVGAALGATMANFERRDRLRKLHPLAELVGLPERRVPWIVTEEGAESVRAAIADGTRGLLPWCETTASETENVAEAEVAEILVHAAEAKRSQRPATGAGWTIPAWFGQIERLVQVAEAVSTKTSAVPAHLTTS